MYCFERNFLKFAFLFSTLSHLSSDGAKNLFMHVLFDTEYQSKKKHTFDSDAKKIKSALCLLIIQQNIVPFTLISIEKHCQRYIYYLDNNL